MKKKTTKILLSAAMVTLLVVASAMPAFAAGDVAGAIENTWSAAQSQIRTVVDNVVFPVVDIQPFVWRTSKETFYLFTQRKISCGPAKMRWHIW